MGPITSDIALIFALLTTIIIVYIGLTFINVEVKGSKDLAFDSSKSFGTKAKDLDFKIASKICYRIFLEYLRIKLIAELGS